MLYRWNSDTYADYIVGSIFVSARSVKEARSRAIANAPEWSRAGVERDVAGEPERIKSGVSFVMGSA